MEYIFPRHSDMMQFNGEGYASVYLPIVTATHYFIKPTPGLLNCQSFNISGKLQDENALA